jgi:beta-N-acetylhexosaminidase
MPPARCFGVMYETDPKLGRDAAFSAARLIAQELAALGINVNCTPVLDGPEKGAHEIIGDRAFSTDPDVVAALGRAVMDGTLAGGVLPVIKHVPGHGRAKADSHLAAAYRRGRTRAAIDRLARSGAPRRPAHDRPLLGDASGDRRVSPVIIGEVIVDYNIFEGVMSDDIGMKALGGPFAERAGGDRRRLRCSPLQRRIR